MKLDFLSIDIGGTNIKWAVINRSGNIRKQWSLPTPQNKDDFFAALLSEIEDLQSKIRGIAISCPGKVDSTTGTVYFGGALPFLDKISLKAVINQQYNLPVAIINDGKAAALAELWMGNLQEVTYGAAITLGTGLGGGLIIDGKLIQGAHFQAGELSFMLKPAVEQSANIENLYGFSGSAVGLIKRISGMLNYPDLTDGKRVFAEIVAGNPLIYPIFSAYCREIAYVIINLQAAIDLEKVVIGGGISAQNIVIQEITKQYQVLRKAIPLMKSSLTELNISACQYRNEANLLGALYHLLLEVETTEDY
ncbi:ROK family protein [Enterococcus sp. HY326]|uniref:ROK family protein n=1 Tax=Enterococcus sp. HY326 TaxID=2971265 RepID=UPI00223F78A3|nr:ROK family protein [Enterococcus sp. HY326]